MDLEHFTQKYIKYAVLHQITSDRLREFGFDYACNVYKEEQKAWQKDPSNPVYEVKPHEVEKRNRYLAKCDQICQSNPKTAQEYCRVSFASFAGQMLVICGVFEGLPDPYEVLNRANLLATEQYLAQRAQPNKHSSGDQDSNPLPPHILNAMFPTDVDTCEPAPPTERKKYGNSLVGQSIRFRDPRQNTILEVTVLDCGTSHMRGDWFEVLDGGESESKMISASDFEDIMANRVQ